MPDTTRTDAELINRGKVHGDSAYAIAEALERANQRIEGLERELETQKTYRRAAEEELSAERDARDQAEAKVAFVKEVLANDHYNALGGVVAIKAYLAAPVSEPCRHLASERRATGEWRCLDCGDEIRLDPASERARWISVEPKPEAAKCGCTRGHPTHAACGEECPCTGMCPVDAPQPSQDLRAKEIAFEDARANLKAVLSTQPAMNIENVTHQIVAVIDARIALIEDRHAK